MVVCFIPPLVILDEAVVGALAEVAAGSQKTCVATFFGMRGVTRHARRPTGGLRTRDGRATAAARRVPAYPTPEDSVRALAAATRYAAVASS